MNESESGTTKRGRENRTRTSLFQAGWQRFSGLLNAHYYAMYAAVFVVVCVIAYVLPYAVAGKELMTTGDSLRQHYLWFVYIGRSFREALEGLIAGHGFVLPAWNHSIGFGADVVSTGSLYYGDPLNYLSVLCPQQYAEYLYNGLILLRMGLAGAAFSFFMRSKRGVTDESVLAASLVYGMGWHVAMFIVHPFFLNLFVYTPLLYAGIDRIFRKQSPVLCIAATALSFLSSFSLGFMACLGAVLYALVLFFCEEGERTVKSFLSFFVRAAFPVVAGVMIAGILLVPALLTLAGNDRSNVGRTVGAVYGDTLFPTYYLNLLLAFIAGGKTESLYGQIGLGPIGVTACIGLWFCKGKEFKPYKIVCAVLAIGACLPAFGYIFNAFIYPSNRWMFLFAFMGCAVTARVLPIFPDVVKDHWKPLSALLLSVCAILVAVPMTRRFKLVPAVILIAVYMTAAWRASRGKKNAEGRRFRRYDTAWFTAIALCLITVNLAITSVIFNRASSDDTGANVPFGGAWESYVTDSPVTAYASQVGNPDDARVDKDGVTVLPNGNFLSGTLGYSFYKSTYNNDVDRYLKSMGINPHSDFLSTFLYSDLDSRSYAEYLSGTRYFMVPAQATGENGQPKRSPRAPQGYSYQSTVTAGDGSRYDVYRSDNATSLAFAYSGVITENKFEDLTPAQAQEAMLQGAVVSDEDSRDNGLKVVTPELTSSELPYQVIPGTGVEADGAVYIVGHAGASIDIMFAGVPDAETYLSISNPNMRRLTSNQLQNGGQETSLWSDLNEWYREQSISVYNTQYSYWNIAGFKLRFRSSVRTNVMNNIPTKSNNYYGGERTWLVNMGYSQEPQQRIRITFPRAGKYYFGDMKVIAQPMGTFNKMVPELSRSSAQVKTDGDSVSGSITLQNDGLIYLSIPYSNGWKARLDGKDATVIKANTAFMAIAASAGSHTFELEYHNPLMPYAVLVSAVGLIGAVVCCKLWGAGPKRRKVDANCAHRGAHYAQTV